MIKKPLEHAITEGTRRRGVSALPVDEPALHGSWGVWIVDAVLGLAEATLWSGPCLSRARCLYEAGRYLDHHRAAFAAAGRT